MRPMFDVEAEVAHIKDPWTRELLRGQLEYHNRIWADPPWWAAVLSFVRRFSPRGRSR